MNRNCYHAVSPVFYDRLSIEFVDYPSLQHSVSQVSSGFGGKYLRFARRLDVRVLPQKPAHKASGQNERPWDCFRDTGVPLRRWLDARPSTVGPFLERALTDWAIPGEKYVTMEPGIYAEGNWLPLVLLIARLERLTELHFVAANVFPSCLLQTIQERHPQCRIHVWSCQRPDLSGKGPEMVLPKLKCPKQEERFEVEVLRSPCVRALTLNASFDYGDECTHSLLHYLAMAPNLKHLRIHSSLDGEDRSSASDRIRRPLGSLKGLRRLPDIPLETLSLTGSADHAAILLTLALCVNLSHLRALELDSGTNPTAFTAAALAARNLQRLFLNVHQTPGSSSYDIIEDSIVAVINALQSLKTLCLRSLRTASPIHRVVKRHGPTLQTLVVEASAIEEDPSSRAGGYKYPQLHGGEIRLIAPSCPRLQELRIQLRRSRGSWRECLAYQAIGQFPSLHTVILDLHYDPRDHPSSSHPCAPHHLREALINAATDAPLATAIWDLIYANQPSRRLRALRVVPFGARFFAPGESLVLQRLSPSLLVKRPPCYPSEPLLVVDVGSAEIELQRRAHRAVCHLPLDPPVPDSVVRVFHDLWPPLTEGADWRTTPWKSLPLEGCRVPSSS